MSSNNTPASFASAAAGQSRGPRHGDGVGDWSRREGRSANGTMTFRRPSAVPTTQSPQPTSDATSANLSAVAESLAAQPALPLVDGSMRYTRDQLYGIYRATSSQPIEVSNLFVGGWDPAHVNGAARGWGKSSEGTVPQDPTVCWDANGRVRPIGLEDMSAEEKELFADVNSTLKPQQQKEGGQGGAVNGRKTSVSHGAAGYNVSSPISASRPATRRRETSDGNAYPNTPGLVSPAAARPVRDESSWLGRKFTDSKDNQQVEEPEEEPNPTPVRPSNLSTLGRSNTAGSGLGGASSLWTNTGQASAAASGSTIGAFGSFALPTSMGDKRFGSMRGESRLAHLMPKQDTSDTGNSSAKPAGPPGGSAANTKESWRSRPRTDTDPFSDDTGGVAGSQPATGGPFDTPVKNTSGDFGMSSLNVGGGLGDDGAGSPETNPFRSPPGDHGDDDYHQAAAASAGPDRGLAGIGSGGSDHAANFGSMRGFPGSAFDGSDRSQTSSVGAKGFPGLGNIAGWGNTLNSSTPDRDRAVFSGAFGNSLFSPVGGDLQSPGFGSVHGVFGPPSSGGAIGATGSLRGTSKLGSLFPASMQAQMPGGAEQEGDLSDSIPDLRQSNPLGAIGREAIGSQGREPDLASRPGRGLFDELMEANRGVFSTTEQPSAAGILGSAPSPLAQAPFESTGRSSTDTPPNPPRTMVMPDRMRWVYLDPQGQTQGPFTGLEMNDWYKANFFTADLRVKKVEDIEFEPLGQLIRRIGNSREPFLVPQMGVAHGQPSLSGTFAHGDRGTVIPPLVGAFPSYGRTLTAEEQNNLERRKQEEQYMLARQREMMAVPQHHPFPAGARPPAGVPGAVSANAPAAALHHHSSAHSLQSQPSFGSMTSPLASAQIPLPGNLAASSGFFDHAGMPPSTGQVPVTSSTEFLRDEYNLQERQMLSSIYPQAQPSHLTDPAARSHLPAVDELQNDPEGFSERLKEFKQLRDQLEASEGMAVEAQASAAGDNARPSQQAAADFVDEDSLESQQQDNKKADDENDPTSALSGLSLTQQVQHTQAAAAAAKRRATQILQAEAQPEAQSESLPMPFPAPQGQSGTPLAAPTAQRSRSTLPDQYSGSRSQSETPESAAASSTAQPPPLAPWARDVASESHKGPSLKEIQEAEAKKAAKAEEAAAAVRRAAAEQEAALQREREKASAAAAPGLPTSSTWANGSTTASGPSSPWSTPSAAKATMAASVGGSSVHGAAEKKKTLADIQREEEARKQKSRESAAQSSGSSHPVGKRYAELASKGQASVSPVPSPAAAALPSASGWATVGAGGKVKAPAGPSAGRSVSAAVPAAKPAASIPTAARAVSKQMSSSGGKSEAGGVAMEEFNKWLHRELGRGITDGIDLNGFVDTLLQLPLDQTIISEAVYANSKTMDGRHFADEFIRRKKLADKGVVEKQSAASSAGDSKAGGGWSEVAKKGGSSGSHQKEDSMPAGFKVVPSRKKGKK